MQGKIIVKCNGCDRNVGEIPFDTAGMTIGYLFKNGTFAIKALLDHRKDCPYYGEKKEEGNNDNR